MEMTNIKIQITNKSRRQRLSGLLLVLSFVLCHLSLLDPAAFADEKRWTGRGDQASWDDDANWAPAESPTAGDDVTVDRREAAVSIQRSFGAKSVTVGGNEHSAITVNDFINGTVEPDHNTNDAVVNRRDGSIKLIGPGTVKLRGTYRDSEESLAPEPSFMITIS